MTPAERAAAYKRRHPARVKASNRRMVLKKYGVSTEEFTRMYTEQGGLCSICGKPETAVRRGAIASLSVDHDHMTGKVRGLLCSNCNLAIGYMSDNSDRLRAAAAYLDRYR